MSSWSVFLIAVGIQNEEKENVVIIQLNDAFGILFLNLNMLGRVWETDADCNGCFECFKFKKVRQIAITICIKLPNPTRSLSRIVRRGQEGPKGSKDTFEA
jgi:hypothetical protein